MANPFSAVDKLGFGLPDMRVVDVKELCEWPNDKGRYYFQVCKDTGGALSRSTETSWWMGPKLPTDELIDFTIKGKAAGLIKPEHMQLYDPHNEQAALVLNQKHGGKYKPDPCSSASSSKTSKGISKRRKKSKPDSPAPRTGPAPRYATVAPGDTPTPPGHALVDHFPLSDKMPVFAIDSEGGWCKGKIVKIVAADGDGIGSATVHFDGWKSTYDMEWPLNSTNIRYRAAPPRKKVKVWRAIPQKLVKMHQMFDLNPTDSDSEDDDEPDPEAGMIWIDDDGTDSRPALNHRTVNREVEVYEDELQEGEGEEEEVEVEVDVDDDDVEDAEEDVVVADLASLPEAAATLAAMQQA